MPADGFYEWQRIDAKTKQPLETYTIITTEPNELTAPIRNRRLAILASKDYQRWMAPADPEEPPVDLLRPFDADKMTRWKMGAAVGNVRNNTAELCVSVG